MPDSGPFPLRFLMSPGTCIRLEHSLELLEVDHSVRLFVDGMTSWLSNGDHAIHGAGEHKQLSVSGLFVSSMYRLPPRWLASWPPSSADHRHLRTGNHAMFNTKRE